MNGVSETGTPVTGRGTIKIKFEFDGKQFIHLLRDVLYVPKAPNCLLSIGQIDDGGGSIDFQDEICWIKNKTKKTIEKGYKTNQLYMLYARAALPGTERSNYASMEKLTWDQWHRRYGHISISALQLLDKENLVKGLAINQSSIPSKMCDACIEAKQAHQPFPKEAKNRSQIQGE